MFINLYLVIKNMEDKIKIYHAAPLFSGRETSFNLNITTRLEERGYLVTLPQRDGFEFESLRNSLASKIPEDDIINTIYDIIYFLDIGFFIPRNEVIVANLDEPICEGVVVEITHAQIMGKYIIGYRTDIRSPFGAIEDPLRGTHFFPAYQCDCFVCNHMRSRTVDEVVNGFDSLIDKIDGTVKGVKKSLMVKTVLSNPKIEEVIKSAELLFSNVEDIHSEEGLEEIVKRYVNNKDKLVRFSPIVI